MKCAICGSEFRPSAGKQKYCSPPCKHEADMRARRERRRAKKSPVQAQCPSCGKTFLPKVQHQKYCSESCRRAACTANQRKARIERGEAKSPSTCVICGKPLAGKWRRAYCSDACRDVARKRQMSEINAARREDYKALKQAKKAKREAAARAKVEAKGRLDAKIREAVRLHISYGQLQVLKAREAARLAREQKKT